MLLEHAKQLLWNDATGLSDRQIQDMISLIKDFCSITVSDYITERESSRWNITSNEQTALYPQWSF